MTNLADKSYNNSSDNLTLNTDSRFIENHQESQPDAIFSTPQKQQSNNLNKVLQQTSKDDGPKKVESDHLNY